MPRPGDPVITPALVAEHGLTEDEYARLVALLGIHLQPALRAARQSLLALGYAGWGAGQLEDEIARRDWLTIPEDAALVFDEDRETVWEHALARRGQDL